MLTWAAIFLIIGIVAGLYGFGGESTFTSQAAKFCFFVFSTLFVISLIYSFLPEPGSKKIAGMELKKIEVKK